MRNFASYVVLGYGSWKVEDIPFFGKLGKGIKNLRTQNIFLIRKAKNSDPSYSLSDSNHLNPNPATRSALPVTFSMSAPGPLLSHHLRSPAIFCQEKSKEGIQPIFQIIFRNSSRTLTLLESSRLF